MQSNASHLIASIDPEVIENLVIDNSV